MEFLKESLLPLSLNAAIGEASRCLYCWNPPCVNACPTGIEIPKFVKRIETGDIRGAAEVILKANFLGGTCGRVCPVEELCEGACVLTKLKKPSVSIGRLQRFAIDYFWAMQKLPSQWHIQTQKKKKVAIVGSGPAGLSCAATLAQLGIEAVILEKNRLPGGLSTYVIPSFREPIEVSLKEVEEVKKLGVTIHTEKELGKDFSLEELRTAYDAVFLAIGLGQSPQLQIPGEAYILDSLEFLSRTKLEPWSLPDANNIVIIGLGNTAIDCALVAKKIAKEKVSILYRKRFEESRAYPKEIEKVLKEAVPIQSLAIVKEAIVKENKLVGLKCQRVNPHSSLHSVEKKEQNGIEFFLPAELVIRASGQQKPLWIKTMAIELDNGFIKVNEKYETSVPRVYAGGDCIRKKGMFSTVHAVEDGKKAAFSIAASFP
ncbi:NADH-dependent dihydropyrimidine dehydrogenase subunit PreT [Candidatus Methylacidiphilum fumarolicum]|nr:FAD-dependent oxidoreductase [Candidatus Methylacidiphilum fumarolicum]MBW6415249.1 FAD-dependent oxidoreductase [Candidatus Methylacidiphilum fumarolicum]TFE72253.1 NADH-dependent dihydropyrimidine dehydrogenase subunit PreT [Candidatus Methylacidiphilum fumarolicum]TFE72395.1 NADH-dependent dihydropyrimidine dehydrogenase subunit PreT [Candidatus Methylacidiphilum fumarolicum]